MVQPRHNPPPSSINARAGDALTIVLLTGMSGTGKSTLIELLAARGYRAVDTDSDEWRE
jgi:predicted ATPase